MGIFDASQYDPQTYSGSGGLIDRLLSQLGVQGQYQPGQGYGDGPQNAQAPAPQQAPQNAPIAVGDYQMPRIGGGFPQPADANAQMPDDQQAAPTPQAQPQALQSFLQPQHSPGGFGGAMRGVMANIQGGPLGWIGGGIAGAMGMGNGTAQDQQQRAVKQTYAALIQAGVPENKAILAAINPTYGQKIVDTELGGDKFGFTTLPDGTVVRQNAKTGEVAPAYQGGTKPDFGVIGKNDGKEVYGWRDAGKRQVTPYQVPGSEETGTVTGPDGNPIAVPAGADRNTFIKEISKINADAAGGKMTETQAKSTSFASRMETSEAILKKLQSQGQSLSGQLSEGNSLIPGSATIGRYFQSDNYQKFKQASSQFITALLRQESGAAINKDEFVRYEKEMIPQPGDGDAVLKQKAEARKVAIAAMKKGAGPSYKSPSTASPATADPLGIR